MTSGKASNYMLWLCLAAIMSMLGMNKQLNIIQTLAVLTIRGIENEKGWSSSGRLEFQTAFVVLVVIFSFVS